MRRLKNVITMMEICDLFQISDSTARRWRYFRGLDDAAGIMIDGAIRDDIRFDLEAVILWGKKKERPMAGKDFILEKLEKSGRLDKTAIKKSILR